MLDQVNRAIISGTVINSQEYSCPVDGAMMLSRCIRQNLRVGPGAGGESTLGRGMFPYQLTWCVQELWHPAACQSHLFTCNRTSSMFRADVIRSSWQTQATNWLERRPGLCSWPFLSNSVSGPAPANSRFWPGTLPSAYSHLLPGRSVETHHGSIERA